MQAFVRHLTLCVSCVFIRAASGTPTDIEQWTNINAHFALEPSETLRLYVEIQPRQVDDLRRLGLVQHQAALVVTPGKALSLYIGYAWIPYFLNSDYHRDYREERRLWQSLNYREELAGVQWLLRLRQEERKIARTDGISNRGRLMLRGSYPLTSDEQLGLTWFDEIMFTLNFTSHGPARGYDRNRLFFGPYWRVESTRYEIGYLGEHQKRFGDDERWAHVLAVSVAYNF
jgi:hypothetical protein